MKTWRPSPLPKVTQGLVAEVGAGWSLPCSGAGTPTLVPRAEGTPQDQQSHEKA